MLPLQSRFAVLSVDDDEDNVKKNAVKNQKKKTEKGVSSNQKQDPNKKKTQKKKDSQPNQNQNQNANKPKNKNNSQKKKNTTTAEQWEQWKEKDAQLVDGNYESELHQAILLSQLDYEENKDVYEQMRKEQEVEKKTAATKKKKKGNKAQTMSLSEFNSLPDSLIKEECAGGDGEAGGDASVNGQLDPDPEFFERIREDAKKAFTKEQAAEQRKAREPFLNDAITIAQYEDQLERRDKEISELKIEIKRLKEELLSVKTRNKTLCQILGQGEMKDKAEVIVQMEKTQKVKDELSSEVERLHALLEQERSKVRTLSVDKNNKGKSKKKTTSENQ